MRILPDTRLPGPVSPNPISPDLVAGNRISVERDPLIAALVELPSVRPDPARADQHRARCRALLERPSVPRPGITLEPATTAAVCAMYVWYIARVLIR